MKIGPAFGAVHIATTEKKIIKRYLVNTSSSYKKGNQNGEMVKTKLKCGVLNPSITFL